MKKRFEEMEQPMNAMERFLYAMIIRQDVVIEQLSSIVEHLAKKDEVAVTSNKVETTKVQVEPEPVKEEIKEEVKEEPVKVTRKRTVKPKAEQE